MVLDRAIVAAGFVTEGAGNPAFAKPGCPGDEQVLVAIDPVATDEPGEDGASMPRGVRKSTSSTQALWRSAANLRRVVRRFVSRSAASRSTRSPMRSSNGRASRSGDRRCSSKALAISVKPSVISRSWWGVSALESPWFSGNSPGRGCCRGAGAGGRTFRRERRDQGRS